jgi:hypothetical protein
MIPSCHLIPFLTMCQRLFKKEKKKMNRKKKENAGTVYVFFYFFNYASCHALLHASGFDSVIRSDPLTKLAKTRPSHL